MQNVPNSWLYFSQQQVFTTSTITRKNEWEAKFNTRQLISNIKHITFWKYEKQ